MTGRVGADLDELLELRRVLGRRADDVDDAAAAVGHGIDRFRGSSSAYVPSLPPHRTRGAELAARLDDLGHRVARTHGAMVAADRWIGVRAALWAEGVKGTVDDAVDGWHGLLGVWAGTRRAVLEARHPDEWNYADVKAGEVARGRRPTADEVRRIRDHRNARNEVVRARLARVEAHIAGPLHEMSLAGIVADTRQDVQRLLGRGLGSYRSPADVGGRLGTTLDRFRSSRAGAVTRIGGRALGGAGLVLDAADTYRALRAGDEERAWTSGLRTVAGAAMLSGFPPVQLLGGVVTGGVLVYEYRDEIADGARALGRGIGSAASAAANFFTEGLF